MYDEGSETFSNVEVEFNMRGLDRESNYDVNIYKDDEFDLETCTPSDHDDKLVLSVGIGPSDKRGKLETYIEDGGQTMELANPEAANFIEGGYIVIQYATDRLACAQIIRSFASMRSAFDRSRFVSLG